MVDPYAMSRWLHWLGFLAVSLVILAVEFLPLEVGEGRWPGPQWILALAMVWTIRRPDYLPIGLAAVVLLASDFLYLRPPGLYAALCVLSLEFLRSRSHAAREWPFLLEWGVISLILLAILLINRTVLGIMATAQPGLGIELQQLISTAAAYPFIAVASASLMGVVRKMPGEPGRTAALRP